MMDEESGEFNLEFFGKNQNFYLDNLVKPALEGEHQYINFATAIACILAIQDQYHNLFKIDNSHINQAISTVYWPSRIEKVANSLNKILKNELSEIWIDGAHNEAGAFSLARWLLAKKSTDLIPKKIFVIAGFSRGKCKKEFLEKFLNIAEEIIAVRVNGEPYPEKSEVILEIIKSIGAKNLAAEDLSEAIHHITDVNNFQPCRIVICGSLHLARDVSKY
jgi:dihydrofolate synthase/folylpolyglutamate synthase